MALLILAASVQVLTPAGEAHVFSSLPVGAAAVTGGFLVMMWAWRQFRQRRLAICPTAKTDSLITGGIYRYTRNPMYLGMIMMMLGTAALVGTIPFYLAAVMYFLIMNQTFCRYEEDKLADAFGDEYESYRAEVRRWV